jgi:hypothetical protein
MPTYEQAIRCPRCGKQGNTRVILDMLDPALRTASSFCSDKGCSFYGRFWFFSLNSENVVLKHTHTIYKEPATNE